MRKLIGLASIIYFGSFILAGIAMVSPRPAKVSECTCPMCRAGNPDHFCTCCIKKDSCKCKMSSGEPPYSTRATLGLLRAGDNFRAGLHPEGMIAESPSPIAAPYRPVLKPPPKA
jgi:hypothetical protein